MSLPHPAFDASRGRDTYSLLTVRRLRPFARRRLRTIRPFFVAIRTLNPCAFRRRRVFGWNVRLPFMTSPGPVFEPVRHARVRRKPTAPCAIAC